MQITAGSSWSPNSSWGTSSSLFSTAVSEAALSCPEPLGAVEPGLGKAWRRNKSGAMTALLCWLLLRDGNSWGGPSLSLSLGRRACGAWQGQRSSLGSRGVPELLALGSAASLELQ